jgi:uncharacterized protein YijF (DUF1287 family)
MARIARGDFNVEPRPIWNKTSYVTRDRVDHRTSAPYDVPMQDEVTWRRGLLHIGDADSDVVGIAIQ